MTGFAVAFRRSCQAVASLTMVYRSGIRSRRCWRDRTLTSVSAMLGHLLFLGVRWIRGPQARRDALASPDVSYSVESQRVLRLSMKGTILFPR